MPIALEVEHDVNEMLEGTRAGNGAVLCHVADDDGRHAELLGAGDERGGDLANLGHPARRAVDLAAADGLDGVEDEQGRLHGVDMAEHGTEVCLGGEVEIGREGADALGPQAHLGRGLLAGDVEGAVARLGPAGGDIEEQR